MVLSKANIIEWRGKYNYPENEDGILNSIDSIKTVDDFRNLLFRKDGILKWKGALRTKHYYRSLDSSKWQVFFDIIKGSTIEPKETVKKIVAFSKENMSYNGKSGGISYPVASTIVYFFSKGNCPIIDWRVIFALKNNGYNERLNEIHLYYNKIIKGYQIYLDDKAWDNFFDLCHEMVSNLKIESIENDTPLRVFDKALWVFPDLEKNQGNEIIVQTSNNIDFDATCRNTFYEKEISSGWLLLTTLGGKNKPFKWRIDEECNIHIIRKFTNSSKEKISFDDLNKLDEYMNDGGWKDLANNIEKLANGTEKSGIGKFLYDELGYDATKSQLSSHLGAIFYYSKVWEFNGKMRGMKFRRLSNRWSELVKEYYENGLKEWGGCIFIRSL